MNRLLIVVCALIAGAGLASSAAADKVAPKKKEAVSLTRPLVVELYTSQNCSSCVVADKAMADMANDKSLLPLTFHVDYMNDKGWNDPFSKKEFSMRQKLYNEKLRVTTIFTPQLVVEGRSSVAGVNPDMVKVDILAARTKAIEVPLTIQKDKAGKNLIIKVAGKQDGLDAKGLPAMAELYMVNYSPQKETKVASGVHKGKTLTGTNIVSSVEFLGEWTGSTTFLKVPLDGLKDKAVAYILQLPEMGAIIGAATFVKN